MPTQLQKPTAPPSTRTKPAPLHALQSKRAGSLLKDDAYAQLRDLILGGSLPPGTFLSERQAAVWLKMSKTPVRAALSRLELEGFVAISPQQGIVVTELSPQDMADNFELRLALESFVVQAIAGRLQPGQIEALEGNLAAFEQEAKRRQVARCIVLDGEFHLLLSDFLGNVEIRRVMQQVRDRIYRVIQRSYSQNPARLNKVSAEHRGIVAALVAGNGPLAVKRLTEHLELGRQFIASPRGR